MNCEIEFLPVGDGCKAGDAIVIRYGDANGYELMVIDGGNLDSGKAVVSHIQSSAVVTHAVVTHPDADHASGMREVLAGLTVKNLWLHKPWDYAAAARAVLRQQELDRSGPRAGASRRIRHHQRSGGYG